MCDDFEHKNLLCAAYKCNKILRPGSLHIVTYLLYCAFKSWFSFNFEL